MRSIKFFFASSLLVTTIGFTSSQANQDEAFLMPILSLLLEDNNNGGGNNSNDIGGNFVVSSQAFDNTVPEVNCDVVYNSTSQLEEAATTSIEPGTTLCLADGTYQSLSLIHI